MSAHKAFDKDPLTHILPENLPIALGLKSPGIAERLVTSQLLQRPVQLRIVSALPVPPKKLPQDLAELSSELLMADANALDELCRTMTLLINHRAILATTSGRLLTQIADWCGGRALILSLRERDFPAFARLATLREVPVDALETYALKVKALLIGLLPAAYQERMRLRMSTAAFPEPMPFAPGDPDKACFLSYAAMAREYIHAQD